MSDIVRVRGLSKNFRLEAGLFAGSGRRVHALNGVDFVVRRGETYGLVGESGSGKTTLARLLVQLETQSSGSIEYLPAKGAPWLVSAADAVRLRLYRSRVKYIFQDPSSSLDPRMNIEGLLTAGARYLPGYPGARIVRERAIGIMEAVGLRRDDLLRRPSEFSGGQRQRIAIARALLADPEALICDEVVSALDVSVQGQILGLLLDLKQRFSLTMLFIAHDLAVVSYMADRVGVMYGGRLMEEASAADLVTSPLHPYTLLLFQSAENRRAEAARDDRVSSNFDPTREPEGCPFADRCPLMKDRCRAEVPPLREVAAGRRAACHFV